MWEVIRMKKYYRRMLKYYTKHPMYADTIHVLGGIGFGIILARPLACEHPVRWGVAFLVLSLAGHWWAATAKD